LIPSRLIHEIRVSFKEWIIQLCLFRILLLLQFGWIIFDRCPVLLCDQTAFSHSCTFVVLVECDIYFFNHILVPDPIVVLPGDHHLVIKCVILVLAVDDRGGPRIQILTVIPVHVCDIVLACVSRCRTETMGGAHGFHF